MQKHENSEISNSWNQRRLSHANVNSRRQLTRQDLSASPSATAAPWRRNGLRRQHGRLQSASTLPTSVLTSRGHQTASNVLTVCLTSRPYRNYYLQHGNPYLKTQYAPDLNNIYNTLRTAQTKAKAAAETTAQALSEIQNELKNSTEAPPKHASAQPHTSAPKSEAPQTNTAQQALSPSQTLSLSTNTRHKLQLKRQYERRRSPRPRVDFAAEVIMEEHDGCLGYDYAGTFCSLRFYSPDYGIDMKC